jgi:hypothetical protein
MYSTPISVCCRTRELTEALRPIAIRIIINFNVEGVGDLVICVAMCCYVILYNHVHVTTIATLS